VDALVKADWLDGDSAYVFMAHDATDADARTVWCEVMLPSGLGEGLASLWTDDQRFNFLQPMPRRGRPREAHQDGASYPWGDPEVGHPGLCARARRLPLAAPARGLDGGPPRRRCRP
jgi:hypothetical protein